MISGRTTKEEWSRILGTGCRCEFGGGWRIGHGAIACTCTNERITTVADAMNIVVHRRRLRLLFFHGSDLYMVMVVVIVMMMTIAKMR